jgi:Tfp pilus assembly protein PilF
LNDYQGALNDLDKAIKLDPNYKDAYTERAYAKERIGDKKGAELDRKKAESIKI